jgi:hypothetical protein
MPITMQDITGVTRERKQIRKPHVCFTRLKQLSPIWTFVLALREIFTEPYYLRRG